MPVTPKSASRNFGDTVMTSESVLVPPSPGFPGAPSNIPQVPAEGPSIPIRRSTRIRRKPCSCIGGGTAAGVKKAAPKARTSVLQKLIDTVAAGAAKAAQNEVKEPFRFLDLPSGTCITRLDRQRTLASDVEDRKINEELVTSKKRRGGKKGSSKNLERDTNRPFFGLTQVCRQLRAEFRPIFLAKQEVGMDLTEVVQYLKTFYFDAPSQYDRLFEEEGRRSNDMPFNGNLTIAVGEKPLELEKNKHGIEVIPLLDLWANSWKIEAGFGRYSKKDYQPRADGEAKDLYRLFGRRVLRNRTCSAMNSIWRSILRTRSLASVTLHRKPAPCSVKLASLPPGPARSLALLSLGTVLPNPLPEKVMVKTKPFIHILFRAECAEPWMTKRVSDAPVNWLAERGFGSMEHFHVHVGVAREGFDKRV
ncbi:hypothetical protein CC86DRAFT_341404 [Ophiobolus disseminans]|uniref:Uncharacterized protein n=1 Tax=Ophiobolus disseminans TaxID=1469910 RepID=A0A6A7AJ58_9PLEO|nr:hypothetical protein CC86DRAFT_341404 [Ophiobolus disseminans]